MRAVGSIKIHHWTELQESFRGADIFLGNGFSININSSLNYRSLFQRFLFYLEENDQATFRSFNSTNFEGIQGKLIDALEANGVFGLDTSKLESALRKLKSGLIGAIKDLHPAYSQIDPTTIFQLSKKLDWFKNIFTTNYDIFLYHITLSTLDRSKNDSSVKKYQDFFRAYNGELRFDDSALAGIKNIYYLHGALFLRKELEFVFKIRRGTRNVELLELIRLQVHLGHMPIFVSEGTAVLKAQTIAANKYLSFCRNAFKAASNRMVIHGFSFSKCDEHLISDLNDHRRKLAIGLHLSASKEEQVLRLVRNIQGRLFRYKLSDILFFDSKTLF